MTAAIICLASFLIMILGMANERERLVVAGWMGLIVGVALPEWVLPRIYQYLRLNWRLTLLARKWWRRHERDRRPNDDAFLVLENEHQVLALLQRPADYCLIGITRADYEQIMRQQPLVVVECVAYSLARRWYSIGHSTINELTHTVSEHLEPDGRVKPIFDELIPLRELPEPVSGDQLKRYCEHLKMTLKGLQTSRIMALE